MVEWVCKALIKKAWLKSNPGIQYGGGRLYVNAGFVQKTWEDVLGDKRTVTTNGAGVARLEGATTGHGTAALKSLAAARAKLAARFTGRQAGTQLADQAQGLEHLVEAGQQPVREVVGQCQAGC